ncbi:MAG: hypothetical protein RLP15_04535 [Cryomorphaceae bacterium]
MNFSSINIQGNIISSDILAKIRNEDLRFQKPADFGLDRNTTIRDEIGIAWGAAQAHWKAFNLRRERLKDTDSGTSETRNSWIIPFMRELGYELEVSKAEIINEKSYAISHRAINRDGFPVHIVGVNQSLDKRADGGARLSPHALVQEYLNNHDHLYAITTNGKHLRLLRDATRLARLSYFEFDLQQMMEEGLYAEFALLFRTLHASRMPEKQDAGADSIIEFYHQEALASGTRIRERLSVAVEQSLKLLANGILKNPANADLREKAERGTLNAEDYYLYLLRTVYRMLFLLVIEERNLIYPAERDEDLNQKRDIYYNYYSIQRLTKLVERRVYVDPRKTDLWRSLMTTFLLFEKGHYGTKLGIQPLGSGLFSPAALGDVVNQHMDNETLLNVLRHLVMFENENQQWTRVNYADLDVEEFGSVYEGLLEYDPQISMVDNTPVFSFVEGTGRSSSGSHYTPEELVKPLIKHSLDYVIEDKLKAGKAEQGDKYQAMLAQCRQLLTIKVCDVACGSGHILLSAARRIGIELAVLRESIDARQEVEQPSPPYLRAAVRDVIRHCIYGVDKNPLAVELCKVALWLEAHNPGEPLNFLDHRIKCGDAIVGLAHKEELQRGIATEAFKALSEAEKTDGLARMLSKRNKEERKRREEIEAKDLGRQISTEIDYDLQAKVKALDQAFDAFVRLPETTPEEIDAKQRAYIKLQNSDALNRLRTLADLQVAQFFLSKTPNHKDYLVTDAEYHRYLRGEKAYTHAQETKWMQVAHEKRFFHYFLEFPEVFSAGGFDAILGNPPYLGGGKISTNFGKDYLTFITSSFRGMKGLTDLVAYFLRRNFDLISDNSFTSVITTNTVCQGDTREGGLDVILKDEGQIVFAIKSIKWPGVAAVDVSILSIGKNTSVKPVFLEKHSVEFISSFLSDEESSMLPQNLINNQQLSYLGSALHGKGFFISEFDAEHFIKSDSRNAKVIKQFLTGDDINSNQKLNPSRWVIFFSTMSETEASKFKEPFKYVELHVKPERLNNNREYRKKHWWQFGEATPKLYDAISDKPQVFVTSRVTKYLQFFRIRTDLIFSDATVVINSNDCGVGAILCSFTHDYWSWKFSSTMGTGTLRYSASDCISKFPFPGGNSDLLENCYQLIENHRLNLFEVTSLGFTSVYNQLNNKDLTDLVEEIPAKEFQKKYGNESWNLYNHLEVKKEGKIGYKEAVQKIKELRALHVQMDQAVLEAYGWSDINLLHDFYEVEYLPENDRVRYTIHPDARKEVLKRLLQLNHQRFEEEVAQGLHKKKDVVKYYEQKGQPVPEGTVFSDGKVKGGKKGKNEKTNSNQSKLEF